MASRIKRLTSGKRRRFNENGFDLDLTYIKPNIIAMGFPSERLEGMYRNHMDEIIRFFDERHTDHYKIYNICSERSYDPSKFHQRVATYPFENGRPPPFELIQPFCEDMDEWLKADDRNVAGIHCLDGLGRTGVMICSYLLHDRLFETVKDALQFFGEARTYTAKGITLPSQQRYVLYYGHLLRKSLSYSPITVFLKFIRFIGIPKFQGGTCVPYFTIAVQEVKIYSSKLYDHINRADGTADLLLPQELPICGDVKIIFYHQSRVGKERMFTICFNTFFVDMHLLEKNWFTQSRELNKVVKQEADIMLSPSPSTTPQLSSQQQKQVPMPSTWKRHPQSHWSKSPEPASNVPTGVPALFSKVNPFTYRKVETRPKQFTKTLKKAGKHAGVDITTGVTALFPRPSKVTSKRDEQQHPIPTSSKLVTEPLVMGLTNLSHTSVIVFGREELDKANKDKKHYPDDFQVHICLLTGGQLSKSVDLNGDYSSEDNATDLSDTDDEDDWDATITEV